MISRQQTIDMVNRSWTKDLIIRFLYVKLAPFFERDLKFFFADEHGQLDYVNSLPDTVSNEVICISLCQFYKNVFENFGISCEIIAINQKLVPHYALIVDGDIGSYYIDPLKDLMNNQAGLRTAFYGILPTHSHSSKLHDYPYLISLPLEYVAEMDSFLNLYSNGVLNDYLERVHLELTTNKAAFYLGNYLNKDLSNFDKRALYKMKMLFLNQYLINRANIPGKIERAQYYNCLLCHILNHSERKGAMVRCSLEQPILARINGTVYIDEKNKNGRVLRLELSPSPEVEKILGELPRFRF